MLVKGAPLIFQWPTRQLIGYVEQTAFHDNDLAVPRWEGRVAFGYSPKINSGSFALLFPKFAC